MRCGLWCEQIFKCIGRAPSLYLLLQAWDFSSAPRANATLCYATLLQVRNAYYTCHSSGTAPLVFVFLTTRNKSIMF